MAVEEPTLAKQGYLLDDVSLDNLIGISMAGCRTLIQCESFKEAISRWLGENTSSLAITLWPRYDADKTIGQLIFDREQIRTVKPVIMGHCLIRT